jgi:hypothetical protein
MSLKVPSEFARVKPLITPYGLICTAVTTTETTMKAVVFAAGVAQLAGVGEVLGDDEGVGEGDGVGEAPGPGRA